MKKRKGFLTKKVFFRFLFQFIIFLLLPVIFALNLFLTSAQLAKQSCIDSSLISLRHVRDEFDNYINALDQIATQLMFEPKLNKVATIRKPQYGSRQVYYIQEFGEELKAKMSPSAQVDTNFVLLLKNASAAYYRDNVVFDLEFYYDKFLNYHDYTYQEWLDIVFGNSHPFFIPESRVLYEGVNISAMTYVFPIVTGYGGKKALLFIIKSTKIEELCKENDEKISRNIFITDSDGNILFGISGSVVDYDLFDVVSGIDGGENEGFYFDTVDNGKYMIVYARSRYNDLIFTEIIPQSVAMSKVNNIKQMTCYMVALYFLIGIVSAVSFAKRNSEPFNELAGKLKPFLQKLNGMPDEKTNSDELEYIRNGVDYLKNTVQQTYYELKDIFLERLFNGSFNNLEDLKQAGEKLNLSMDGSFYCVAVMELLFSETWEENIKRKAVQNIYEEISRSLPDFVLGVNLRKFRINFLFTLQSNNKESMDNIMNFVLKVKSSIQRDGRVNAACGIGLVVPSLTDVQFSYEQAIFTLNNVAKKSLKIIQYGDLPDSTLENIFYYPIEMGA